MDRLGGVLDRLEYVLDDEQRPSGRAEEDSDLGGQSPGVGHGLGGSQVGVDLADHIKGLGEVRGEVSGHGSVSSRVGWSLRSRVP